MVSLLHFLITMHLVCLTGYLSDYVVARVSVLYTIIVIATSDGLYMYFNELIYNQILTSSI